VAAANVPLSMLRNVMMPDATYATPIAVLKMTSGRKTTYPGSAPVTNARIL
jgi:hypothetical protein